MTEMIVELLQKPFIQALFFILITILSVFIIGPKDADSTWVIAGYIFIGFMLVNSILICTVSNSWSYFFYSLGFSALYLVSIGIIISTSIKLLKIEGSAESAMIFIFIIYHPVLLLFMLFLKWVYFKIF
jgi:hypothetical protein